MGTQRCKWVRGRLPLLVGDDLRGLDRRRVERHLIGCPQCRQHQAALGQALETLRTASVHSPVPSDAPSLWPALARQIRESRRPAPASGFGFGLPLAWLRINLRPWPALGVGLGLGLSAIVAAGVGLGLRPESADAPANLGAKRMPVRSASTPSRTQPVVNAAPAPSPHREPSVLVEASTTVESSPPSRIDYYDLEHGRPMPDTREARDTQATY